MNSRESESKAQEKHHSASAKEWKMNSHEDELKLQEKHLAHDLCVQQPVLDQQRRAFMSRLIEHIAANPTFRQQLIDDTGAALNTAGLGADYAQLQETYTQRSPDEGTADALMYTWLSARRPQLQLGGGYAG